MLVRANICGGVWADGAAYLEGVVHDLEPDDHPWLARALDARRMVAVHPDGTPLAKAPAPRTLPSSLGDMPDPPTTTPDIEDALRRMFSQ